MHRNLPRCPVGKCDLYLSHREFLYGREVLVLACRRCHYVASAVLNA